MCGRFTLTLPSAPELASLLGVEPTASISLLYRPRWNIAPTDPHWVVRLAPPAGGEAAAPEIVPASWGVAPPPAPDGARRPPLINARSETVARMPGVRDAFHARGADRGRCVVPACGFYEWVGAPKSKRPIWFSAQGGGILRFAGLWEPAASGDGVPWRFTILTTRANDVVAPVHDRMPVILAPNDVDAWLGADAADAAALLRPAPPESLAARAVVPRANSVKNDDPGCLDPWDPTLDVDLRGVAEAPPAPRGAPRKPRVARTTATPAPASTPASGAASRNVASGLFDDVGRDPAPKSR